MTTTSSLTKSQFKKIEKPIQYEGKEHILIVTIRYDDQCNNGHNTFSITGEVWRSKDARDCETCGCIHDIIAEHCPELRPLIKWHLCSSEQPLHYVANTRWHAGDRDCNGLRAGEVRQIRTGGTGPLCWELVADKELKTYVDSDEMPTDTVTLRYVPWTRTGEGKERDLEAARRFAIWPDATDEELISDGLEDRLAARLPALMAEFKLAMESLGFVY